jgi:Tol biopolymer transport system component
MNKLLAYATLALTMACGSGETRQLTPCDTDNDCLEERVCVEGSCEDPSNEPVPMMKPFEGLEGKIAFSLENPDKSAVAVINANGMNQKKISGDFSTSSFSWSYDGTKIAYTSLGDANSDSDIHITEIHQKTNESTLQNILDNLDEFEFNPKWSPVDNRLAFRSFFSEVDNPPEYNIYILDASGTQRTQLTRFESGFIDDIQWSPDGTRIAFTYAPRYSDGGNLDLYMVNADGTDLERLTTDFHLPGNFDWAPNGGQIAFSASPDYKSDIYVVDVISKNHSQLTDTPSVYGSSPKWSPNGQHIAYLASDVLYVMDADGQNQRVLDNSYNRSLDWSPDSKTIVFSSIRDTNTKYDLWLVDIQTLDKRQLTDNPGDEVFPEWSR